MTCLLRLVRAVVLEPDLKPRLTISWPAPETESETAEAGNFVKECIRWNRTIIQAFVFELATDIFVTVPMTKADSNIVIRVEKAQFSGAQQLAQQRPMVGPCFQMAPICERMYQGDKSARTAVICHAFGEEMISRCGGCEDGPFGSCVVYRNKSSKACSNCICTGREKFYKWRTYYDRASDEEYDSEPHRGQRRGEKEDHDRANNQHQNFRKRQAEKGEADKESFPSAKRCRSATTSNPGDHEVIDLTTGD